VNAKERLRAYLQQRRELGESEMVLDALEVDDVMRMLGALQGGGASAGAAPAPRSSGPARDRAVEAPSTMGRDVAEQTPALSSRESDAAEGERAAAAPPREPVRPPERSRADEQRTESGEASEDWREVMRNLQSAAPRKPLVAPAPANGGATPTPRPAPTGTLKIEGIVFPLGLRVERPNVALMGDAGANWHTIDDVTAAISACTGCGLVQSASRPVPGIGNPTADVLVVGEAPGEREDEVGEPFVGPAGQLLDKILGAIQLSRESVYICNVLKHRPPGNRNPMPEEIRACAPFLQRQIDLIQPKLILAFGAFAAQSLLETKLAIGKLRQQIHWYQGIPLVATYHPAALLRNEAWKRPTWEDVKLARRVLDATVRIDDGP
jgi:uracil-DNA glycosylase